MRLSQAKNIFLHMLLAVIVGILVGILDAVFGRVLIVLSDFRTTHVYDLLWGLPLAGLLITWMYYRYSKLSLKGMTLVFETGQQKREGIPLALIPLVMVGTWLTHLFGGSAGREGVAVQLGATLSHGIGKKMKLPDQGHVMLVTGMAAGFGGLFQTPLTAAFFAIEVITAGVMDYEALLPALIGAYTASITSHELGLEKFQVELTDTLNLNVKNGGELILLGILFGIAGFLFSNLLKKSKTWISDKIQSPYKRIGYISIPLALALGLLWGGRYCGLGTNLIAACFSGDKIYAYDWILKLLLTIITLSIGFQGGEVTPLFSMGATLGFAAGSFLGLPPMLAAALGYAAVFGSATNTLIAPILIGLEVFGSKNMGLFVVVCVISYVMNGNCSIYGAQRKIETLTLDRNREKR